MWGSQWRRWRKGRDSGRNDGKGGDWGGMYEDNGEGKKEAENGGDERRGGDGGRDGDGVEEGVEKVEKAKGKGWRLDIVG